MSQINISNLTFSYNGSYDTIFKHVSFCIDTNWKLGFIGRNGKGKTTFFHLLMGKYDYSGHISSNVTFEHFPYDVKDKSQWTIEVISQIYPDYVHWQLVKELSLLEADDSILYRPFQTLSDGEQTKVLLAILFLKENSFLLIDEPTNHLDAHGREIIRNYLNQKSGFILIAHDRAFVDGCVDHILSINNTNIEIQKGNFSSWLVNKERQDCYELTENKKCMKEISRLSKAAKQASTWSYQVEKSKYGTKNSGLRPDRGYVGHKAAKMMQRSKSIQGRRLEAIEEKAKLLKNIDQTEHLKLSQPVYHSHRLASFRNVSICYEHNIICKDITFTIEQGDRIALNGNNGCGKSSILKLVCGYNVPYSGEFYKGSNMMISYVSQNTDALCGTLSDYAAANKIAESVFKAILRKLDFTREQFDKEIQYFSGGQKKKVLIAKSLCQPSHLLIWDEPLNYIDVISRMQLEQLLLEYKPTMLFVEHDQTFREHIATKTIEL